MSYNLPQTNWPTQNQHVPFKNEFDPLVAIIFNILSTMFYAFEEINCRWCTVRVVVTCQEYREGRCQSVAQRVEAEPALPHPPPKPATVYSLECLL